MYKAALASVPILVMRQQNTAGVEDPVAPRALAAATLVAELSLKEFAPLSAATVGGPHAGDAT